LQYFANFRQKKAKKPKIRQKQLQNRKNYQKFVQMGNFRQISLNLPRKTANFAQIASFVSFNSLNIEKSKILIGTIRKKSKFALGFFK